MASVPSTPARYTSLPSKSRSAAPVTPTRHHHPNHRHQRSLFVSSSTSSPFTPLSYGSEAILNTPESSQNFYRESYSELAQSWQAKVAQHGVSGFQSFDASFVDDDGEQSQYGSRDPAILATPFHTHNRARGRAHSLSLNEFSPDTSFASRTFNGFSSQPLVPSPLTNRVAPSTPAQKFSRAPVSPLVTRRTLGPLNTPPPNRALAQQYKFKGSVTDPVRRKRPSLANTQVDLFDIDENEFYPDESFDQESFYGDIENSFERDFHLTNRELTFEPTSTTQYPHQHYHQQSLPNFPQPFFGMYMNPPPYNVYTHGPMVEKVETPAPPPHPSSCSVCGRRGKGDGMLAVLQPCEHPLCSTCLTSALNIVGEKDMECAVCKTPVVDFKLVGSEKKREDSVPSTPGQSFFDPVGKGNGRKVMHIEEEDGLPVFDAESVRASTPKFGNRPTPGPCSIVLRIDNVPWDITPPVIMDWLRQPVERVHVLLDRKGKTLSHAYVEVQSEDVARAILRGETSRGTSRSSVLGKGKRARGVTVTRNSQEELMSALFPSWKGAFDGNKPSLVGLSNSHIASSLEGGLLTETEVASLLKLIQSPDSHFLKVPILPFHSLISLLAKFPGDIDSKVFCPSSLRDKLYDVTDAAVKVLFSRIHSTTNSASADELVLLVTSLLQTAMSCQAFSDKQVSVFAEILHKGIYKRSTEDTSTNTSITSSAPSTPQKPHTSIQDALSSSLSYIDIAAEFGVQVDMVKALADRLSGTARA